MAFLTPGDVVYARSHEWLKIEGDVATVGISDYAQDALGDVVYVELPQVGDRFEAGTVFGTIESVKAASDLYAPATGEVVAVNTALEAATELINTDPYGGAWMMRIKIEGEPPALLDAEAYAAFVAAEAGH